jgi:hypothetical protein
VAVIYLIALPLALLVAAGWVSSIALVPGSSRNWFMAVGSVGFCTLLSWRLWLNLKATGRTGPFPSPRRFWRIFVPLGLLAAAGLCLTAMGVGAGVIAGATWNDAPLGMVVTFVTVAAMLIPFGGWMCWPFARLLLKPPSTTAMKTGPASADDA